MRGEMYPTTTVQSSTTFKLLICLCKLNLAMFTASMGMDICTDASPFFVWLLHTGYLLCSEIMARGAIVANRHQSWVHLVVL